MQPITKSAGGVFRMSTSFLCECVRLQVSDLRVDEVAFNQAVISDS
jgi:hypothetical protein